LATTEQEDLARAAQAAWGARCNERRKAWEAQGISFGEAFRRSAIETRDELGPRPGGDIVGLLFTAAAQIAFLATVLPLAAPILGPARQIKAWADRLKAGLTAAGVNVPDPVDAITGAAENLMAVITFSWLKVFWSGARAVLWGLASLIVPALIASIFSADAASYISAHVPLVGGMIAAAFMGLGNAAMNAWKNWNKPAAQ
jgi:hypothetical protein